MINIPCTNDCIYQKEGQCKLEDVPKKMYNLDNKCAYYDKKDKNCYKSNKDEKN